MERLNRFVGAIGGAIGGAVGSIGSVGGDAVVSGLLIGNALLLALELNILLGVVMDVQTKITRVDVAVAPDQESAEDRLGEDVEDTVEDGL